MVFDFGLYVSRVGKISKFWRKYDISKKDSYENIWVFVLLGCRDNMSGN